MPYDTLAYYLVHEPTSNLQGGNCRFVSLLYTHKCTQARHLSVFLVDTVDLDVLFRKIFV